MTPGSNAQNPSRRSDEVAPRLKPARALRALHRLSQNPDQTAEVFTIIEALSGRAPLRILARFRADARGRRLLAERPHLLSTLADRPLLESMPSGSLAHAYLAFLDREGITADGLVQASDEGRLVLRDPTSELSYVLERIRDSHDLWHTVTGYQGDVIGEAALLSFSVAQLRNPGVAMIVMAALLQFRELGFAQLIGRAFVDGLRTEWLASADWEALLPRPILEVRALLRIPPRPSYVPLRTRDMRAMVRS